MENFIYSLNATVPVFLIMILGYFIHKRKLINDNFVAVANKFVFNIALPALLFYDISSADIRSDFDIRFVFYCMLVTTICFATIWVLTEVFMKDDSMKGSFIQGSFRGSAAILGMAFIKNVYNDAGLAPLMIVSAVPLYNIFSVIVLTFKAKTQINNKQDKIKKACINILKNPIILAIFAGIPFSVFKIHLPVFVNKTFSSLAGLASPLALIVIGASFEGKQAIKKIKPTIWGAAIKLIIQPLVFLPIAMMLGFRNQEMMAIIIMLSSPSTVSCYIMAKNMDNDDVLSSSIIVLTTLLSSITITVMIFAVKCFGYL